MAQTKLPRILACTPELTFWPGSNGVELQVGSRRLKHYGDKKLLVKEGGLADMTSALYVALKEKGVNIGVAIPHLPEINSLQKGLSDEEIERMKALGYLIEQEEAKLREAGFKDYENGWNQSLFSVDHPYFRNIRRIYEGDGNIFSLTFQREVLRNIIPKFSPDLIHTHDWMTGLIGPLSHPNIKTLHTVHNIHSNRHPVSMKYLYDFGLPLYNHEKLFLGNGFNHGNVDFQMSGIFGSDFVNTPSEGWLIDIANRKVPSGTNPHFVEQIIRKLEAGRAFGIINAPDPSYAPEIDPAIFMNYSLENLLEGKKRNKMEFQDDMNLIVDSKVPLLLWPNRADPSQKGPQHLNDILHGLMQHHQNPGVQIAIIADGPYIPILKETVHWLGRHGFGGRIAITKYNDALERQAFAAADAVLVPSLFEPCGLPQLKAPKYGCLPIVRATGGLRDTVIPIDKGGFGVVFEHYDSNALWWGINNFLDHYNGNKENYLAIVRRAKEFADKNFTVDKMAESYIKIFERILGRKVVQ